MKGCVGCFSFTAAHLWPYKLFMHLLASPVSSGLNLQPHTPVLSISPSTSTTSPGKWIALTPRGAIKDNLCNKRLRCCAPPRIRQKNRPLERNMLPHHRTSLLHHSSSITHLWITSQQRLSRLPDPSRRRLHHRRRCSQHLLL